jgi:hypothetical protein
MHRIGAMCIAAIGVGFWQLTNAQSSASSAINGFSTTAAGIAFARTI